MKEEVDPDDLFYEMAPIGKNGYFSLDALTVLKDVFNKIGYFDTSLRVTQDTHFMVRLVAICRIATGSLKEPVAVRGVHDSNRSTKNHVLEYYPLLFQKLFDWGYRINLPDEKLRPLWKKHFYYNLRIQKSSSRTKRLLKKFFFLVKVAISKPTLLQSRFYWDSVPVLRKFF